jgi:hypothetical protein
MPARTWSRRGDRPAQEPRSTSTPLPSEFILAVSMSRIAETGIRRIGTVWEVNKQNGCLNGSRPPQNAGRD